jgi:hypothetical protein
MKNIYASSSFIGHSLWLVPSTQGVNYCSTMFYIFTYLLFNIYLFHMKAKLRPFQDTVTRLATELKTHSFLPHVTLLAGKYVYVLIIYIYIYICICIHVIFSHYMHV